MASVETMEVDAVKDADDDENEEDDDEDEDEEPKLKYERIGSALLEILKDDAASCMVVHAKFLALGTHWGVVHILDHQGNDISSKKFPSHTTTVNQLSIDSNGEYVASCAEDGRVVINGLYTTENNVQHMFDCPIHSVSLHPEFGRRGNKQYVIGIGEKLTLFEKGWLRNKSTLLHSGEGFVRSVSWRKQFIAWANSQGVEVYDAELRERVSHIERDEGSPRDDLFRCNISWKDDKTFFIAWANVIKVCKIIHRPVNDKRALPSHIVEILHIFRTDFFASGIAPFGEELAILAYFITKEDGGVPEKGESERPQLLIIAPEKFGEFTETSMDILSVRGFEEYKCNDYNLEHSVEDKQFYIVTPKDIVIAKPRDLDDHVSWLIERVCFKEALDVAEKRQVELKRHSVQAIGEAYLDMLINQKDYQEAALMCDRILGKSKKLWEDEVYRFAKHNKLKILIPYIPLRNPQLGSTVYEMVLFEVLKTQYEEFYKLIKEWSSDLYRGKTIIAALERKIKEEPNEPLFLQALATLYANEENYKEALQIYLKLGHKDVFDMISKHSLLGYIQENYLRLMEIETTKAVAMFTDNLLQIKVDDVVKQLRVKKKFLHLYLDGLFTKDPQAGIDFHDEQVELYAEFQRERLLSFLRNSNYYQLEKALRICEERSYFREMVFLLGRMGNHKKALTLIIEKMGDIHMAIEFAKEENDEDLWDELITQSLNKPEFIKELLFNIGTYIDPKRLIKRIPPGLEIPKLRDALVKILHDFNLQVSLHEGCKTILDKDSVALIQKQFKSQTKGYSVIDSHTCQACHGHLVVEDSREATNIVIFFCQHVYHDKCLQQDRHIEPYCLICASKKTTDRKKTFR